MYALGQLDGQGFPRGVGFADSTHIAETPRHVRMPVSLKSLRCHSQKHLYLFSLTFD